MAIGGSSGLLDPHVRNLARDQYAPYPVPVEGHLVKAGEWLDRKLNPAPPDFPTAYLSLGLIVALVTLVVGSLLELVLPWFYKGPHLVLGVVMVGAFPVGAACDMLRAWAKHTRRKTCREVREFFWKHLSKEWGGKNERISTPFGRVSRTRSPLWEMSFVFDMTYGLNPAMELRALEAVKEKKKEKKRRARLEYTTGGSKALVNNIMKWAMDTTNKKTWK